TVLDKEAPRVDCIPTTNPGGNNVPPASPTGNPDGFFQLIGTDNGDPNPKLYIKDSVSGFVAGPFYNGDKVKITQAKGAGPNQKPMAGAIKAHITIRGNAMLYGVDASGNRSAFHLCVLRKSP